MLRYLHSPHNGEPGEHTGPRPETTKEKEPQQHAHKGRLGSGVAPKWRSAGEGNKTQAPALSSEPGCGVQEQRGPEMKTTNQVSPSVCLFVAFIFLCVIMVCGSGCSRVAHR